ncbi:hypothetical protein FLAN108750_03310 [Flavobacterium antarcticum]
MIESYISKIIVISFWIMLLIAKFKKNKNYFSLCGCKGYKVLGLEFVYKFNIMRYIQVFLFLIIPHLVFGVYGFTFNLILFLVTTIKIQKSSI